MKTKKFDEVINAHKAKVPVGKNMLHAFFFGGLVSIFGQSLIWLFETVFEMESDLASTWMIIIVVLLASLLTGLGIFDRFGQIAKAGAFIPISGFANSLTSAAMEGRSEGWIVGIGMNTMKLAGVVIVYAVLSGFFFGMLRYLLIYWGVISPTAQETAMLLLNLGG